ncbi:2'-5' RNA ligase family protein [Halococcus sp. IIIV-5B]|uniref:2'-5' RNA ligase family protein n=1 Tax=Halococcus sp. IIIV-5B TaxID=2321230 RepID=UPI000E73F7BC|nr:2'-5' RNA ligase family protein [Halococcus sp. IIIV-5B]RJT04079.1 2'-5' RNA ligase family protein [Halococcus sp. IIIV-5B]
MYSLNVPVPGEVKRLAAELRPRLMAFERIRERHSLLVKRFESADHRRLSKRVRRALAGAPAVEARIATIESFDDPVRGPGPVVYLAVESPGLVGIHDRLVEHFDAVPGLEGSEYVPHVTLARGGSAGAVEALRDVDIDPIEWVVPELVVYDAVHRERVSRVSLPTSD